MTQIHRCKQVAVTFVGSKRARGADDAKTFLLVKNLWGICEMHKFFEINTKLELRSEMKKYSSVPTNSFLTSLPVTED